MTCSQAAATASTRACSTTSRPPVGALLLLLLACDRPAPRALAERAYVWQRAPSPALDEALRVDGPAYDQLSLLVLEVEADGSTREIEAPAPAGPPIEAVLRANLGPGGLDRLPALAPLARQTVDRLRAQGQPVDGLELDVDLPTSRLGAFVSQLQAVQQAVDAPLSITGLPDWLRSPDLPALLAQTQSWTLQLHDLRPPDEPERLHPLFSLPEATEATAAAAALGHPFWVALPTYAYTLRFRADGAFAGLRPGAPHGPLERRLRADPAAVAAFVARLRQAPPPSLVGIRWFRLPLPGETEVWHRRTLAAVRAGRAPQAQVEARLEPVSPGLFNIIVENTGEEEGTLAALTVLSPAPPLAGDAQGGARLELDASTVTLRPPATPLPVEGRQTLGWLRYAEGITPRILP